MVLLSLCVVLQWLVSGIWILWHLRKGARLREWKYMLVHLDGRVHTSIALFYQRTILQGSTTLRVEK